MIRRSISAYSFKRGFRKSTRIFSNINPGTILENADEIDQFLNQPSWSVKELLNSKDDFQITDDTVKKMIKLSGFNSDISKEDRKKIASALTQQMGFIRHLYDNEDSSTRKADQKEDNNDTMFRLIASDHNITEPLTLDKLLEDIKALPEQVSSQKGETGFNIAKLHPENKSSYFTFKARQG